MKGRPTKNAARVATDALRKACGIAQTEISILRSRQLDANGTLSAQDREWYLTLMRALTNTLKVLEEAPNATPAPGTKPGVNPNNLPQFRALPSKHNLAEMSIEQLRTLAGADNE